MRTLLHVYNVLFVANFQLAAQYRVQSVLWLLFAVIRPVVFLAAWSAAANAQGGTIGDFTRLLDRIALINDAVRQAIIVQPIVALMTGRNLHYIENAMTVLQQTENVKLPFVRIPKLVKVRHTSGPYPSVPFLP